MMCSLVDETGVIDGCNAATQKLSGANISLRKLWKSVAVVKSPSRNVSSNLLPGESKWESAAEIGVKPFFTSAAVRQPRGV